MKTAPTPIITAVLGFCAAALLAPQPAQPQSFNPRAYAAQFCYLRSTGVPYTAAIRAALNHAWDNSRHTVKVQAHGRSMTTDQLMAVDYVLSACPQYIPSRGSTI